MALTYGQILDRTQYILQDTTPTYFSDTELGHYIPEVMRIISESVPFKSTFPYTLTTDGTTRRLKMSSSLLKDLINIPQFEGVEYKVDQSPPEYRNFKQQGNYIYLLVDTIPTASLSVYVYPYKLHVVQESIGTTDTAGAVKTAGTAGDTTLALKSLGTGTINENTVLSITGDTTEYIVQATATIGTNEATVTIHPPLQADVDADVVVSLSLLNTFTLTDARLENVCCNLLAGLAAINKASSILQETELAKSDIASGRPNIGDAGTEAVQYLNYAKAGASIAQAGRGSLESWGQNKLALVERELRGMTQGSKYQQYSRS